MAEYTLIYTDLDALQREIDTRGWTLDEGDVLAAAKKGDTWVKSATEKHGAETHDFSVLVHYATQWAWYQVIVFKIGDRYRNSEEPLFMKSVFEECMSWFKGGVATYKRSQAGSVRINRGVPSA